MILPEFKAKPLPNPITTERLTLKRHVLAVADVMFQAVDQDRNRLREFLPWVDAIQTLENELSYVAMTETKWEKLELFDYGLYRTEGGAFLGNIGVHEISWTKRSCHLGYWILGAFEGQGFISEAVSGLEKAIFEIGFHRIEIRCSSRNRKSALVPKRNAYRLEAVLSEDSIENGEYRDTLIFAKLASHDSILE